MVQGPIQQRFVDNKVVAALIRNGLPYDSPLREKLNSEAEIIGPPVKAFYACETTATNWFPWTSASRS